MDDLDTDPASQAPPAPPTTHPPAPLTSTRAPGRPSRSPEARQAADERYAQLKEIERGMPARAREFRFAIFPVRQGTEHKATHRPLKTILWSAWQEEGLEDDGALASYLERVLGPGRYLIEPRDAHNKRVDRLATFCIATDEEEDNMYDYDDDMELDMVPAHGGRRRRRRRGFTEDLPYEVEDTDDDPIEARTNIADMLTEQVRLQAKEREATTRSSGDMVQTMLLLSQQREADQERRREDEHRREEAREQARREEYRREEDRRAEDRRREEERRAEERRREDDRRAEERRATEERSAQRIQLMLGAFTAAVPLLKGVFEQKPNTLLETVIAKTMEPKDEATNALLLKHVLDKSQGEQSINQVIQGMASVSKATVDMLQQQFSSMQGVTSEMYQTAMKRALDVAMKSPNATEEDKGVLGQIMDIMSGAGELIGNLRGGQPQPQPVMMIPGQQVPMQPGQQVPMQPVQQVPGQPVQQPVAAPEDIPTGIRAVGACLMAIQQQAYADQTQYQNLLAMMISEMPEDVRKAVAANDEATVLATCGQIFAADPELKAWITAPGSAQWLREFLAQLAPQIEDMHQQIMQTMQATTQPPKGEQPTVEEEEGGPHFIEQGQEGAPPLSMDDIVGGDDEPGPGEEEGEGEDTEDGDPNDPI